MSLVHLPSASARSAKLKREERKTLPKDAAGEELVVLDRPYILPEFLDDEPEDEMASGS